MKEESRGEMGNPASLFKGKTILVTGGTGSFGNYLASKLVRMNPAQVRILSRHENLQFEMKRRYPEFRFILGDVRDFGRVQEATKGVDIIFHAAALKQVPDCEIHPVEAVKTNVLGADNVKRAAIEHAVESVIYISTDKAVKPVNVMGMTKALQEKIFTSEFDNYTKFIGVRYGNVIGSRGSVIPYFFELAQNKNPLPVTHPEMTRFLVTLEDAIDLVFYALKKGRGREIFVRKSPAAKILDLAKLIGKHHGVETTFTQIRPGEKIHETLVQEEEMSRSQEEDRYYIIYPYGEFENKLPNTQEYTSNNTTKLSETEIEDLLKREGWLTVEKARVSNPSKH